LPGNAPRRTLVRSAIAMLLANPALAQEVTLPYAFAGLDKPGIPLLIELLDFLQERPGINTAMLLEHFADRPESTALQKLALNEIQVEPEALRTEFIDTLQNLDRQAREARRLTLEQKLFGGISLSDDESTELEQLNQERVRASVADWRQRNLKT